MQRNLLLFPRGVFVLAMFLSIAVSGQTGVKGRIDFLAPQVADFMKYGNVQVPYYTGQSGFSIPLFQINTKGFNIPITLNYNSEGFKPTLPTGTTGMNWYLSATGAITRKVNKEPDESTSSCGDNHPTGYYLGVKNSTSSLDASVFNFSAPFTSSCGFYYVGGAEYEPDEFSFNCLGHSGKFYLGYGGNVSIVSNEDIKVDLSSFAQQSYANNIPAVSAITLTTSDGYKFSFGGNLNALDYSWQMPGGNGIENRAVITTWHLTRITSPEGKIIFYNYKAFNPSISNDSYIADPNFYVMNKVYNTLTMADYTTSSFNGETITNTSQSNDHQTQSYSLTKTSYLESILSDDFTLLFQYSQKARKFYYTDAGVADPSPYHKEGLQLDAITLSTPFDVQLKKIQFNYAYLGGTHGSRHMLTSLTEAGVGNYNFNYYRTTEFPSSFVRTIDHWGYWKGGYSDGSGLIPAVSQDANGNQTISSTLRDADASYCNVGLLQQVTYPTGGTTTFNYEAHQYAARLERRSDNGFMPQAYVVSGTAGGARISSITDVAAGSPAVTKTFKYLNNYIGDGTASSGFLMDWPRYIYYWVYNSPSLQQYRLVMRGSSFHTNYNTNENYINYGEVTEESTGNGYKVMKFNNYVSNPDYSDYNTKDFDPSYTQYVTNQALYRNYIGFKLNDRSQERGLNREESLYDNSKSLVKSTTTSYPTFNPGTDYIVSTLNSGMNIQAYKIYTTNCRAAGLTTITNSANPFTETKSFGYDILRHQLKSESITTSDGYTRTKYYTYANDYAGTTPFIADMKTAGMTGLPIEELNWKVAGAGISILSGKITEYYPGGKGLPQITYNLETSSPIPGNAFKSSSRPGGVPPYVGPPNVYAKDSRYQPVLNNTQYDAIGNPLETITSLYYKGSPTAYKWGYNDQYPIAEVKNSKLADVYLQDFELYRKSEVFDPLKFDGNIALNDAKSHTGRFSALISNSGSAEKVSHSNEYIILTPGNGRKFTYSGWVYSNGPSSQLFLFMYKSGETGYFSYIDNVDCYQTGKWTYVTKTVSVPDDVISMRMRLDNNGGGDVWFDDLAIRPADAQLKTFTYKPLVGIQSKIEGNGQTTYYEYDASQRLKAIKDQNLNILKSYDYHFSGQ